jgi:hypothetical protein
MKRLLRKLDSIADDHPKHFLGRWWKWGRKGAPRRWHALLKKAHMHVAWNRAHHRKDRLKWWVKVKTVYRRKWKRVQKHRRDHPNDPVGFESWMLNGHSGGISPGTKQVVAYAVGVLHAVVTDTYDYSGHAPTSNHYPRNNADGLGHAVDLVPATCSLMTSIRDNFNAGFFKELFGPCPFYYTAGAQHPGMFPGHGTHTHAAPVT